MQIPGFAPTAVPPAASGSESTAVGAPPLTLNGIPHIGPQIKSARKDSIYGIGDAHRKRLAIIQQIRQRDASRSMASNAPSVSDSKGAAGTGAGGQAKKRKKPTEDP